MQYLRNILYDKNTQTFRKPAHLTQKEYDSLYRDYDEVMDIWFRLSDKLDITSLSNVSQIPQYKDLTKEQKEILYKGDLNPKLK